MSKSESPSTAGNSPSASWSLLNEGRRATKARWPTIWHVPVTERSTRYARARIRAGERVLDVGSSHGGFGEGLRADYATLDIDPEVAADFRTLDDVAAGTCDVVVCFEMIEHVSFAEGWHVAQGIARALKPGGRLFLSTPNIHHPWSYLRSATHVTPWCYDELGGLLTAAGLVVDGVFRCHHDAFLKGLLRRLAHPLYRIAGIDYAKSILITARRRAESTRPEK